MAASPRRIFLARHGQSVANVEKRVSGQLDFPLSPKGMEQAQALRDVLRQEKLSAIYSSSLSRAVETARPTAEGHGLEMRLLDDLREIHLGDLQGQAIDFEEDAAHPLAPHASTARNTHSIPGAEAFADFERRIVDCLDEILENIKDASLVVAHRNTNEVILARLLSLGPVSELDINVKNKYLYQIELGEAPSITTIRLGGERHGQRYAGLKCD